MRVQRLTDEAIAAQIGSVIKAYRLRRDLTQDQLATAVGVSIPTIQNLEKGKGSIAVLIAALRAINCLDLLAELMATPRQSPLRAVRAHGKLRRRASGGATKIADKGTVNVGTLLIARRNTTSGENR